MTEGTVLVASDASCHPEVIGDAAVFFDPHSTDDLVAKLRSIIDDGQLRKSLIKKGKQRVTMFSWERMAEETVAVYRAALQK